MDKRLKWFFIVFLTCSWQILAQEATPNVVALTTQVCAELAPSSLCFVTEGAIVTDNSGIQALSAGSRMTLQTLQALQLAPVVDNCGMAIWNTRAYASTTWDTEASTVFASGNLIIQNLAPQHFMQTTTIVAPQGANIRSGVGDNFRVVATVAQGETLKAIGRLADNSWVQVLLRDGQIGWLTATALSDTLDALPVVAPDANQFVDPYLPLTNMVLQTSDTLCQSIIASGLLIQSEKISLPIRYQINGVLVDLFGTVFIEIIRVETGANLLVYNLEGDVTVIANGQSETVKEGYYTTVLLDTTIQNPTPVATPSVSRFYNYERVVNLPIEVLERKFYVTLGDVYQFVRPKPEGDISPLSSMLATEPCRLTTGEGGTNIRAGAGTDYPIMAVLGFRESVAVQGRATGSDGQNWWQIAPYLWVSGQTTVTGGDCIAVPTLENAPVR
jgi:uncharacterized protein YgiM (DUF1202 family)